VRRVRVFIGILIGLAALAAACERETREYQQLPVGASRPDTVHLTGLQPGQPQVRKPMESPYEENAWGMGEGKRLYQNYNCSGCHAMGGGGIGPALMDDKWIYGSTGEQIYSTIVQGRPNGMPAFGGRIPNDQIWQIVAYVQSLSGLTPQDAASSRDDDMSAKKPEARKERETPKQTGHR
jgi:cytochrome c oxidase cbb3-type subunit III